MLWSDLWVVTRARLLTYEELPDCLLLSLPKQPLSMCRNPTHFITHSMHSLPYLKLDNQKTDLTITSLADKPLHCRCPPSALHPGSEKKHHIQRGHPQGVRAVKGERAEEESEDPRALYLPVPCAPPPLHCESWEAPARDPESGARPSTSTALRPQAPAQQHRPSGRAGGKGSSAGRRARDSQGRQEGTLLSRDAESSTSLAGETQGWAGAALLSHLPSPSRGRWPWVPQSMNGLYLGSLG